MKLKLTKVKSFVFYLLDFFFVFESTGFSDERESLRLFNRLLTSLLGKVI